MTTSTTTTERVPAFAFETRVAPQSYDPATRSFEVVMSTGVAVRRRTWGGDLYEERLSLDPEHVDLDWVNSGRAPFLRNHNRWSLDAQVGSVVEGSVRIEDGQIVGRVQMHETDDAKQLAERIARGELPNVSVGYETRWQERTYEDQEGGGTMEVRTAVDWTITELSLVTVPADRESGTRSNSTDGALCTVETHTSETRSSMPPKDDTTKNGETGEQGKRHAEGSTGGAEPQNQNTPGSGEQNRSVPGSGATPAAGDATATAVATAERAATERERTRASEIRSAVSSVNLPDEFADRLVNDGTSVEDARTAIIDELAGTRDIDVDNHVSVEVDEASKVRGAVERALLHRAQPTRFKLEDGDDARAMVGDSLLELGARYLGRSGIMLDGLSRMERAAVIMGNTRVAGAHAPSDFPLILANSLGKSLRNGFELAPSGHEALVNPRTVNDFKPISVLRLTDASQLDPVSDAGEYTYGTVDEEGETYRIFKYGKILALTRETIVNDDLNAFTRIPQRMGQQAARLEAQLFWAVVTANAAMADGNPLFHVNHGNVGTGGITTANIGALDTLMGTQQDVNGSELDIQARYLVVPRALWLTAMQTIGLSVQANAAAETSPYRDTLQVIASPYLDSTSASEWYLFASPDMADTIEMAHLAGNRQPYIETQEGFEIDGVKVKIRHEVGFKAIEWRSMAKSTG